MFLNIYSNMWNKNPLVHHKTKQIAYSQLLPTRETDTQMAARWK